MECRPLKTLNSCKLQGAALKAEPGNRRKAPPIGGNIPPFAVMHPLPVVTLKTSETCAPTGASAFCGYAEAARSPFQYPLQLKIQETATASAWRGFWLCRENVGTAGYGLLWGRHPITFGGGHYGFSVVSDACVAVNVTNPAALAARSRVAPSTCGKFSIAGLVSWRMPFRPCSSASIASPIATRSEWVIHRWWKSVQACTPSAYRPPLVGGPQIVEYVVMWGHI